MKYTFTLLAVLVFVISGNAQEIIDQDKHQQNIHLTNEGWDAIGSDSYSESIRLFSEAIKAYSGNTDSYAGRATAYLKTKQFNLARQDALEAIKLSPDQADLHYLLGNILVKLEDYPKAILNYTQALELNEQSEVRIDVYSCHYNRGNAYLISEKYESAVEDFSITLEQKTNFAGAYHNRAIALRHLDKKEDACTDFKTAVHFGSDKSAVYVDQYCKGVKTRTVDYAALATQNVPNTITQSQYNNPQKEYSRIISDTLYYNMAWELCSSEMSFYYRVCTFDRIKLKFIGEYIDYYKNGVLLEKGSYDDKGMKQGYFERYYENGNPYSKGSFENHEMAGIWDFFHENGNLKEKVMFESNDFTILDSNDEDKTPGVVNGEGEWIKEFVLSETESLFLTAPFENGQKHGRWKIMSSKGYLVFSETFKKGKFMRGLKHNGKNSHETYYVSKIQPVAFSNPAYYNIEKFMLSNQGNSIESYPYFNFIPEKISKSEIENNPDKYQIVEEQPSPLGGMVAFYQYLAKNIRYPSDARKRKIQGKVYVQFVVDKDGRLIDVQVAKGIGGGCDEEAVRLVKSAPPWKPGTQRGKPVKVQMVLPITFKLG